MVLIWKTLYKRACGREMKSSEPSPFLPLKSEIEILREFFLQVANEQTPENFLDTRCKDNRCAEKCDDAFSAQRLSLHLVSKKFSGVVSLANSKRFQNPLFQILNL